MTSESSRAAIIAILGISLLMILPHVVYAIDLLKGLPPDQKAKINAKLNAMPTKSIPPTGQFRGFNYNTKETVVLPSPPTYTFTTIQNTPCPGQETLGAAMNGGLDRTFDNQDKEYDQNPQMALSDLLITKSPDWNSSMYHWCGIYSAGSTNTDESSEQQNNNVNKNPNVLH